MQQESHISKLEGLYTFVKLESPALNIQWFNEGINAPRVETHGFGHIV